MNKPLTDAGNLLDNSPGGIILAIGPENVGNLIVGDNLAVVGEKVCE